MLNNARACVYNAVRFNVRCRMSDIHPTFLFTRVSLSVIYFPLSDIYFPAVKRALMSVGKPEWAEMATAPFGWDPRVSETHAGALDKLETTLIQAGFDAPDAGVEEGKIFFESLEAAAGVMTAAPFGEAQDFRSLT